MRFLVQAVLAHYVAASPRRQSILCRRALSQSSGMRVNSHRRRDQPALPPASDTADPEVDVLEIGEERRVEPADVEECGPIEGRGSAARREGIEDGSVQN